MESPMLKVTTGNHPITAATLLDRAELSQLRRVWFGTRFDPLDEVLGGGFRPRDLVVVGGRPGVGKTVVTLQWARAMAANGFTTIYVSYEHEERVLLSRLLGMELREASMGEDGGGLDYLRSAVERVAFGLMDDDRELGGSGGLLQRATARLRSYADRLVLVRASGASTGLADIDELVGAGEADETVVFVDYLQKVPVVPEPTDEAERLKRVASGLKELALSRDVTVVAVAATDRDGLTSSRTRMHHIRGAEAIAYEADVILLLNEKATAVSKAHRAYDAVRARTFDEWVVFSLEKHRRGEARVDLEFRKDLVHWRFEPEGRYVADRLVDGLLEEE